MRDFQHLASDLMRRLIADECSVKMHDLKTNEKRTMDLLVMENLFWKQDIERTFDLKGIGT